jgi:hypothetical protein
MDREIYEVCNVHSKPWNYRLKPRFCLYYPYKMTPSGTISGLLTGTYCAMLLDRLSLVTLGFNK